MRPWEPPARPQAHHVGGETPDAFIAQGASQIPAGPVICRLDWKILTIV
jgi:hypothetical protein